MTGAKKKIAVALILAAALVGMFFFMEEWKTPDIPTFNDKFTRQFLISDADTPEGFHMLESGTKKYSILVPDDYVMIKELYYRKKGIGSISPDTENIYLSQYGVTPKDNNMDKGISLFLNPDGNIFVDTKVNIMLEDMSAPKGTEVKKIIDENKTVYYADNIKEVKSGDGAATFYYMFGLITDNRSKQAISFELDHTCFDSDQMKCPIDFEKEKKMGIQMMESIKFSESAREVQ